MEISKVDIRLKALWTASMAALILSSLGPAELFADSFRCGRKVVRTGDSSGVLLQKCGEPRFKDRTYQAVKLKDGRKNVRVERWHYQKSARSLSRSVLIYQGNIVGIETGGR
jgi:hypothetical protein